jgi:hypothetical protein
MHAPNQAWRRAKAGQPSSYGIMLQNRSDELNS